MGVPEMAKQGSAQKATVARVMHEFKEGELDSSAGDTVRNPKQAIAIALSEAGASNRQSPEQNSKRLAKTKDAERTGQTARARGETRAELYKQATRENIAGRSKMTKAELQRALKS